MTQEEYDAALAKAGFGPAQSSSSQSSMPEVQHGALSPFIQSFLGGTLKWAGEAVEGAGIYLPGQVGDTVEGAGQWIKDIVPKHVQDQNAANMNAAWPILQKNDERGFGERVKDTWTKITSSIGDRLPMILETTAASKGGEVAAKLMKIPNTAAKGMGLVAGLVTMASMVAPEIKRRIMAQADASGKPIDEDIADELAMKHAMLQAPVEYVTTIGMYGVYKLAAGKKAVESVVDRIAKVMGKPYVEMPAEGIEEGIQGKDTELAVREGIRRMQERNPGWTPKEDPNLVYGLKDFGEDALMAGLMVGFMQAAGKTERLLTGRVDEEQELRNKVLTEQIASIGQTPFVTEGVMAGLSTEIRNATKTDEGFKRSTLSAMMNDRENMLKRTLQQQGKNDVVVQFDIKQHNAIYDSEGPKAAAHWLGDLYGAVVVPDTMKSKDIMDTLTAWTAQKKGQIATYQDPDTGRTRIAAEALDGPSPISPQMMAHVTGSGMIAPEESFNDSHEKAAKTGEGDWHKEVTRADLQNDELLTRITGTKDPEVLKNVKRIGSAWFDRMGSLGADGKLLYSFASFVRTKDKSLFRKTMTNSIVDGKPVLSLYHGFKSFAMAEEAIETFVSPGFRQIVMDNPEMLQAHDALVAELYAFNRDFNATAGKVLEGQRDATRPERLETPEARRKALSDMIVDIAGKIKAGNHRLPESYKRKHLLKLVGSDGHSGLLHQVRSEGDVSSGFAYFVSKQLDTIKSQAGLLTDMEHVRNLYDWAPMVEGKITDGMRERFSRSVNMNLFGNSDDASLLDKGRFSLIKFSPERAERIRGLMQTLMGSTMYDTFVKTREGSGGRAFDLGLVDPDARPGETFILSEAIPKSRQQHLMDAMKAQQESISSIAKSLETLSSKLDGLVQSGKLDQADADAARKAARQAVEAAQAAVEPAPGKPMTEPQAQAAVQKADQAVRNAESQVRVQSALASASETPPPAQEPPPAPESPSTPPAPVPPVVTPPTAGSPAVEATAPVPGGATPQLSVKPGQVQRLLKLGYSKEAIEKMTPDDAQVRIANNLKPAGRITSQGENDQRVMTPVSSIRDADVVRPESEDQDDSVGANDTLVEAGVDTVSAEQEGISGRDNNSQDAQDRMKSLLSTHGSRTGRFAAFVTLAAGKRLATKVGEDLLYADAHSVNSFMRRVSTDQAFLDGIVSESIKIDSLPALHQYLAYAVQHAVGNQGYSQNDLRAVSKAFSSMETFRAWAAFTNYDDADSVPTDLSLAPVNSRSIIEAHDMTVRDHGGSALFERIQKYAPGKKTGKAYRDTVIDGLVDDKGRVDVGKLSKWLEAITGINARSWRSSYNNTQDRHMIVERGPFPKFHHTKSATAKAFENLIYHLGQSKTPVETEQQAFAIIEKAFLKDKKTRNNRTGLVNNFTAPVSSLGLEAADPDTIEPYYNSIARKRVSSRMFRSQELDEIKAMLGSIPMSEGVQFMDGIVHSTNIVDDMGEPRRVDRKITWDEMAVQDRYRTSGLMALKGFIEMGQMGDKTTGVFMWMTDLTQDELMDARDALANGDSKPLEALSSRFIDLYAKELESVPAEMKPYIQTVAELKAGGRMGSNARTRFFNAAYALYNLRLAMRMNGDLRQYIKKGRFDYDVFAKRLSQGATPAIAMADGKTIKAIAIEDLDVDSGSPDIIKAVAELKKLYGIDDGMAKAMFDGAGFFLPSFGERYTKEMGTWSGIFGENEKLPFGIKAHYRADGTLIKVNWLNLQSLATMAGEGSFFARLLEELQKSGVELVAFAGTGIKTGGPGPAGITKVWSKTGNVLAGIKPNVFELRSERFYSPLDLNASWNPEDTKFPKQREHNEIHLKHSGARARLISQWVQRKLPKWKRDLQEIIDLPATAAVPQDVKRFTNATRTLTYERLNGSWFAFDASLRKRNKEAGERAVTDIEALDAYKRAVYVDLFGSNDDLVEMCMDGVNPLSFTLQRRTLPLLASKLERMMEVKTSGVWAQSVPGATHPALRSMSVESDTVNVPSIIANIQHEDGTEPVVEMQFKTMKEAQDHIKELRDRMPWMFHAKPDMTPDYGKMREDLIRTDVRDDGAVVYVTPGEYLLDTRTPADNVPSGIVATLAKLGGPETAAVMHPIDVMTYRGEDLDGDKALLQTFRRVNGRVVFDESDAGIANRIMMTYIQDALDKDQAKLWKQHITEADSFYPVYKKEAMAAKQAYLESAEYKTHRLNSWHTNDMMRMTNILSQRTVGVAAALNRFLDFATHYGWTYQKTNSKGAVVFEASVPQLPSDQAYLLKKLVTGPLISLTVDDPKYGYLSPLGLTPSVLGVFVANAITDKQLLQELGSGNRDRLEQRLLALLQEVRTIDYRAYGKLMDYRRYAVTPSFQGDSVYGRMKLPAGAVVPAAMTAKMNKAERMMMKETGMTAASVEGIMKAYGLGANVWDAHTTAQAMSEANRTLNVALRSYSGTDIIDIMHIIGASVPTMFKGQFEAEYGPAIVSAREALMDVMDRNVVMKNLVLEDFERDESLRRRISKATKAITSYAIRKAMQPASIDRAWFNSKLAAMAAGEQVPGQRFLERLEWNEQTDKLQLQRSYAGHSNPDTSLWNELPPAEQAGLYDYMVMNHGFGLGLRNGSWMDHVPYEWRVSAARQIDAVVSDPANAGAIASIVEQRDQEAVSMEVETSSPVVEQPPVPPPTTPPVQANDEEIAQWHDEINSTFSLSVKQPLWDAILRSTRSKGVADDEVERIRQGLSPVAGRDFETTQHYQRIAMEKLGGYLGTASAPYETMKTLLARGPRMTEEAPGGLQEARTGQVPGVGMGQMELFDSWRTPEIQAHDDLIEQAVQLPVSVGGAKGIQSILVREMAVARANREMMFRDAAAVNDVKGGNPYLRRVASFVKEEPERFARTTSGIMDPWAGLHGIPAEYHDLAKAYHANKAVVDAMIDIAAKSWDDAIYRHNEALDELSLDGYINYLTAYVPHLWDVSSLTREQLAGKLKSFASNRAKHRTVPTLLEGYDMGLVPLRLDLANLMEAWSESVFTKLARKRVIEYAMTVVNANGESMVVPVFAGHSGQAPKLLENVMNDLAMSSGEPEPVKTSWSSALDAFPKLVQRYMHKRQEYIPMPSPYGAYDRFYVHPEAEMIMKTVLDKAHPFFDTQFYNVLNHVNVWAKFNALQFSLFHPISILTGVGASLGGHHRLFKWHKWRPVFAWNHPDFRRFLSEHPEFERDMIEGGLEYGRWLDLDATLISEDLAKLYNWAQAHHLKPVAMMAQLMQKQKAFVDKHMWRNLHAMSKMYLAYDLMNRYTAQAAKNGVTIPHKQLTREIAEYVNVTAGGIDFNRVMFATPSVRKAMHLFLLAPDWTISNLDIARAGYAALPGMGWLGKDMGLITKKESLKIYWPTLFVFSFMLPNLMQFIVSSIAGDDDDDKLAMGNEEGREKAVDITALLEKAEKLPVLAKLGLHLDRANPAVRFYMDFSKQINETGKWFEEPMQTLMSKTSQLFKIAFEQVTGRNTMQWKLPFADESFARGLFEADGQWLESRTGYIAEKFLPMTVTAVMKDRPAGFIAPISKGMTRSKSATELAAVFKVYAEPRWWNRIAGNDEYVRRLDELAPEILAAAEENGVDTKELVKRTRAKVLGEYNDMLFRGINTGNDAMIERASEAIVRLGGAVESTRRSFIQKYGKTTSRPDQDVMRAIPEHIRRAKEQLAREGIL